MLAASLRRRAGRAVSAAHAPFIPRRFSAPHAQRADACLVVDPRCSQPGLAAAPSATSVIILRIETRLSSTAAVVRGRTTRRCYSRNGDSPQLSYHRAAILNDFAAMFAARSQRGCGAGFGASRLSAPRSAYALGAWAQLAIVYHCRRPHRPARHRGARRGSAGTDRQAVGASLLRRPWLRPICW